MTYKIFTMATSPNLFFSSGSAAAVALTTRWNAICVVQKESTARVIEKLHQLPDIENHVQ